jgi:hypothetical protein
MDENHSIEKEQDSFASKLDLKGKTGKGLHLEHCFM